MHRQSFITHSKDFPFLNQENKEKDKPSFFSKHGLAKDILSITNADPDIPLEVFHYLYEELWPIIQAGVESSHENPRRLSEAWDILNAWVPFLGTKETKGILTPPESLVTQDNILEIVGTFSTPQGQASFFAGFEQVKTNIINLRDKLPNDLPREIFLSLDLVQDFFQKYRDSLREIIEGIINKPSQGNLDLVGEMGRFQEFVAPKAVMIGGIFSNHWAYRIPRKYARRMLSLNETGNHTSDSSRPSAQHRVSTLPFDGKPLLYFKISGLSQVLPHKDFALYSLYKQLEIPLPETGLLILTNVREGNYKYFFAVQATEAVEGSPATEPPHQGIDEKNYSQQVIGAMLVNPSDGKPENYIHNSVHQTWVSIDNEDAFAKDPEGLENEQIKAKSCLFFLELMEKPVPSPAQTLFLTLDYDLVAYCWLKELCEKNKENSSLASKLRFQNARSYFVKIDPLNEFPQWRNCLEEQVRVDEALCFGESYFASIKTSRELLGTIKKKLEGVKNILRNMRSSTLQEIFQEVSPILGRYYSRLRATFKNDYRGCVQALFSDRRNGPSYSQLDSLLTQEEIKEIKKNYSLQEQGEFIEESPEEILREYKTMLTKANTIDRFIEKHGERLKGYAINVEKTLAELEFLKEEGFTGSTSTRIIIDFYFRLGNEIKDKWLEERFKSLIESLPLPELKWLLDVEAYFLRQKENLNKKHSSTSNVIGAFMHERVLSPLLEQHLFNKDGGFKKNESLTGKCEVNFFPVETPLFFFKKYPEYPGYEYASTLFMRALGVSHLPYQDLLLMGSDKKHFPVLLTQAVDGDVVHRIWKDDENCFDGLDPFHTYLQIICAMILNPEDGKEDNFVLTKDRKYLIPVDGDHVFLPGTKKNKGSFWDSFTIYATLQTKTLLFCLEEMNHRIPEDVRERIINLDIDKFLLNWMNELVKLKERYDYLTDDAELLREFREHKTFIGLTFYKPFIDHMYYKFHKIRELLHTCPDITPFGLLKVVEPFVAKRYKESFFPGKSLRWRFLYLTTDLYPKQLVKGTEVRKSVINTNDMMNILNITENEMKTSPYFQRAGPLYFLDHLKKLIEERKAEGSHHQQNPESESSLSVFEFDGLKQNKRWFVSLFSKVDIPKEIREFFSNPKERLSIKSSSLITAPSLMLFFNQSIHRGINLKVLYLQDIPTLDEEAIQVLIQECTMLQYLNVSGCKGLQRIRATSEDWRFLIRLEAKECDNLEEITLFSDVIAVWLENKKMDITISLKNSDIKNLDIFTRTQAWEFSYNKAADLRILKIDEDVSDMELLLEIPMLGNIFRIKVGDFSVDGSTFMSHLNIEWLQDVCDNNYNKLKIDENFLFCIESQSRFNFQHSLYTKPKYKQELFKVLRLYELARLAQANKIDLASVNYLLSEIHWANLTVINLSDEPVQDQEIELLVLANWPALEQLLIKNTGITSRGIEAIALKSNWSSLRVLDISGNRIQDEGLDFLVQASWPHLEKLFMVDTQVTGERIRNISAKNNWPNLKMLDISKNQMTNMGLELLVSLHWSNLEKLTMREISLTLEGIRVIAETKNIPNLRVLDISQNKIKDQGLEVLALGKWEKLEQLVLKSGEVSGKGVEKMLKKAQLPNLTTLNVANNEVRRGSEFEMFVQANFPKLDIEWEM